MESSLLLPANSKWGVARRCGEASPQQARLTPTFYLCPTHTCLPHGLRLLQLIRQFGLSDRLQLPIYVLPAP